MVMRAGSEGTEPVLLMIPVTSLCYFKDLSSHQDQSPLLSLTVILNFAGYLPLSQLQVELTANLSAISFYLVKWL